MADRTVHAAGTEVPVRCVGDRSPGAALVVLEAGGGNNADTWSKVLAPIAAFARACTYDRPTLIHNGVGPRAGHSPDEVLSTLRETLGAAGEKPPYVMVGHSYGGMIVRLYATRYPSEVAGLVLVDSAHEDQLARFDAIDPNVSKELRAPSRTEAIDLEAFSASLNANRWHSTIPLVVLTRGMNANPPPGKEWQMAALENVWRELQGELATRSPAGTHVIATHSGHYIQIEEPGLVIDAVRSMVTAARAQ